MRRLLFFGLAYMAFLPGVGVAEEPPFESQYLLPATLEKYPSISSRYFVSARKWQGIPGLERSPNGRLWAVWYTGGSGEGRDNYVVLATSGDDGKTWSEPRLIIEPQLQARAFDPTLWVDPLNRLWLFWAQGYQGSDITYHNFTAYKQRAGVWAIVAENSNDPDPKWSDPRRLCDGIMMNKPLVTSAGEWLLPASIWDIKKVKPEDVSPDDTGANVIASSDQGKTWSFQGRALASPRSYDEHMLTENRDGSLRMWIRTGAGIAESLSEDGGQTWSVPKLRKDMSRVGTRFFIRRLKSGRLLLVANQPPEGNKRSHLTASLSEDDGVTWKGGLLLDERVEGTGVSYPDGVEGDDGVIRIIYDLDRDQTGRILMASFTENDILKGGFVSPDARAKILVSEVQKKTETSVTK